MAENVPCLRRSSGVAAFYADILWGRYFRLRCRFSTFNVSGNGNCTGFDITGRPMGLSCLILENTNDMSFLR